MMMCADFKSILIPENNGKQNLHESYTNKHQNHVGRSYCYKLVCVDDQFSKPFKSYLCHYVVHKFLTAMVKESKYCSRAMKKRFNKEFII